MKFPQIIQGGMGAGVSDWLLARSVSLRNQIGVVSGTALDVILARRLQMGDPGGHMQRALKAFPDQSVSRRIFDRYFIAGGKPVDQPFARKPMVGHKSNRELDQLMVASGFAEVFLAKEGHDGLIGINFLHKIQAPLLATLYGAMLAGIDIVLVGAGIPLEIPRVLEDFTQNEPAHLKLYVKDAPRGQSYETSFDPKSPFDTPLGPPRRPQFFPIVSSATLAGLLAKKCPGQVDGLIIEGHLAGGHNAPPRGKTALSQKGEPVYGDRDAIDLPTIKALGIPFFLAGSYGSPNRFKEALAAGAAGVQVGTLFAFCDESGLTENLKQDAIASCRQGTQSVFTDPIASPTGFPFKVLSVAGSHSDSDVYDNRGRRCDLGYLREAYQREDGTLAWRCPAEDPETYVRHGGKLEDTVGRKCLCNGLLANIGLPQIRKDKTAERPLVTCGDDLSGINRILGSDRRSYSSSDVIDYLLATTS
jgi:nitronate monooxygenase